MDLSLALLLALVGGFLFVETYRNTRYISAREEGNRLYFRSAFWGAALFTLSLGLLGAAHWMSSSLGWLTGIEHRILSAMTSLLRDPKGSDGQISTLFASLLAMLLGKPVAAALNRLGSKSDEEALADALESDGLEALLFEASVFSKQLMLTLSGGKVYVGIPLGIADPKRDRKAIVLLPVMSGYRTETQKVVFTTFYDQVLLARQDIDEDDLRIAIPLDKILSIAYFDASTYNAFQTLTSAQSEPPDEAIRNDRES